MLSYQSVGVSQLLQMIYHITLMDGKLFFIIIKLLIAINRPYILNLN